MKTLIRSIVTAVSFAIIGGAVSTASAQRVSVEVRLGTPGYQLRHYRHGYHYYRQGHRLYVGQYRRPVIVIQPRSHYYRRPLVVRRGVRAHGAHRHGYH